MKIKANQVYWFREGLKIGAQDHMLDRVRTIAAAKRGLNIVLLRDNKAFDSGYELGFSPEYGSEYKQCKSLIHRSIDSKDINPDGWGLYRSVDGRYHVEYVE